MGTSDSDAASRDGLIESHLALVRSIARRYAGRGAELDDLVQVGAVGLIKASDRFDPERGVAFASFAAPVIDGEIRHHLRDQTASVRIPRKLEHVSAQIRQGRLQLASTLGRLPTVEELAGALDIDAADVEEALNADRARYHLPLSSADDPDGAPPDGGGLGDTEDRLLVNGSVRSLNERERRIVFLRFHADMTERQIARELGISQAHVSRLLREALAKLREELASARGLDLEPDVTRAGIGAPAGPRIMGVGTSASRTVEQYLELPYHIEVRSERDADRSLWKATVGELPGCVSRGDTADEALARLRTAMESWLASALEEDRDIPLPNESVSAEEVASKARRGHSGRFLVRMPSSLHERLAHEAERAHLSLNRFVTDVLEASVARSESEQLSPPDLAPPSGSQAPGSRPITPRAMRFALVTNLVVVVLAGVAALVLVVLALQRGI